MAHHLEMRMAEQVRDVVAPAGKVIVDAQDLAAVVSRRSHRCEPRKPAPPVTRTRLLTSPIAILHGSPQSKTQQASDNFFGRLTRFSSAKNPIRHAF